jgi:hypothetical protein
MIEDFKMNNLIFTTENKHQEVRVYSVGNYPLQDYTMQATIVESILDAEVDAVIGIPVGAAAGSGGGSSGPSGVSYVVSEVGYGNGWIYRKWSSGKCELSRCYAVDNAESNVTLRTPFLINNLIPFICVTNGNLNGLTGFSYENNEDENTTVLNIEYNSNVNEISIKLEGLWK